MTSKQSDTISTRCKTREYEIPGFRIALVREPGIRLASRPIVQTPAAVESERADFEVRIREALRLQATLRAVPPRFEGDAPATVPRIAPALNRGNKRLA